MRDQMIKSVTIHGLRGFGEEHTINFAVPQEMPGSGLTILVGANNTGKTTILEALRSFNSPQNSPPSFSERKRNQKCENGKIHLKLQTTDDAIYSIDTIENGGSTTIMKIITPTLANEQWDNPKVFVLQSRRFVEYEFGRAEMGRYDYIRNQQLNSHNRTSVIHEFNARLFQMQKNKIDFDLLLKKVLGYDLQWTIEQNDNGSFYLKLIINGCIHSSEGLGDGIWSVFTICDALYDSEPGSIIAIDEPELSLHPAYQKRIMDLFKSFSKDRQIIVCTHSPYFIDIESLANDAYLYRTVKTKEGNMEAFLLSKQSCRNLTGFLTNINQPHTLGTEAKEIFFLEDNVIITEGQEDVVMYTKAAESVQIVLAGTFFGWGSGGASNISKIAKILMDLGYKKVVAIFDGDKVTEKIQFEQTYPTYCCQIISAPDVRDKPEIFKQAKLGIMTESGAIKDDKRTEIINLFQNINGYFNDGTE